MPASPRETVLCRYRYDPLDRLADCAPSTEASIQRFYCKSRLATEIQDEVQHSVFQYDEQLLAQLRREDAKAETTLLATDQQRSVLNALDASRLHPLVYTPYGHRPAENGLLSLLGFNGEQPDPVTRHYLLGDGYRAFNPVLMRFNSPDSLSPFGEGGLNAYGYCSGDPINWIDPTGQVRTLSVPTPKMGLPIKNLVNKATGLPIERSTSTAAHRRAQASARVRKFRASLRSQAKLIKENEALLKDQTSYTKSNRILDLEKSLAAYRKAQFGYDFKQKPDVNKKFIDRKSGLVDTTHHDIYISHLRNLVNSAKVARFKSINPDTPIKATTQDYVYRAIIDRAKYIKEHTRIDLLNEIRQ
ncbi:RHS repeat-associated core domain-containing protein [Pseudomonas sp. G2-4]|uniref:RHS repeat-associated core domain-containing protein n=1 Tax=Pseudomonas sp. G2-4 TaxID=1506334 RepID=UPI0024BA0A15|nr:RHS repeat-associated core domain-containing protein [Pseudomonas sp. G2-4]WHS60962.1 RHS repeat-associated core domain-containing protein [Pseudomonas sp. G2-4]